MGRDFTPEYKAKVPGRDVQRHLLDNDSSDEDR
jgi:hypothetical protein